MKQIYSIFSTPNNENIYLAEYSLLFIEEKHPILHLFNSKKKRKLYSEKNNTQIYIQTKILFVTLKIEI